MAVPLYTDQQTDSMRKIMGGYVKQASPDATASVTMGGGNDMTLTNRMNAGAASMAASNQPKSLGSVQPQAPSYDIFSRPGDSFGDSQFRAADYDRMLRDAANVSGFGAKGKREAMLQAAQGMIQPGLAQIEAQNKDYNARLNQYGQQQQGMLQLGMLGADNNQQAYNNYMAGLAQIYGGNQSQPSFNGNQSQPTPATQSTIATPTQTTATTPSTATTTVTGSQVTSALPENASITDRYNWASNLYSNMNQNRIG